MSDTDMTEQDPRDGEMAGLLAACKLIGASRVTEAEIVALRADLETVMNSRNEIVNEAEDLRARVAELEDTIDRACNALTDSILVSGNHATTNMHWVRKLRAALGREK